MALKTDTLDRAVARVLHLFNAGGRKEALEQAIALRDRYPGVDGLKRLMGELASQAGQEGLSRIALPRNW